VAGGGGGKNCGGPKPQKEDKWRGLKEKKEKNLAETKTKAPPHNINKKTLKLGGEKGGSREGGNFSSREMGLRGRRDESGGDPGPHGKRGRAGVAHRRAIRAASSIGLKKNWKNGRGKKTFRWVQKRELLTLSQNGHGGLRAFLGGERRGGRAGGL